MRNEHKLKQFAQQRKFWSQLMEDSGYETYFSGKWHVKIKPDTIFNHVIHQRPGMPRATPEGYNRPIEGEEDPWSPYDPKFGGFWEGGKHWSEVLGDDAVNYIRQASEKETPFFMYLAFNAPHDPRQSPKAYVDMYPWQEVVIPENYLPEYPYKEEMGCGVKLRDERLAPFPRTEYAVKVNRQEYYAIISHMDDQIGRILDALEKSGKKDNTYIFFTADHGLACGNHGLLGKQNMYDHSVRPPLIVVGPDVPVNKRHEADVYLQDIMATSLDLAGVKKPQYVEFSSLLPLIRGKQQESSYEAVYGAYRHLQRMVRADGYKLILYPEVPVARLFDMKSDPMEMNDLSRDPAYQETKKTLFGELLELQVQMEDTVDLRRVFPELTM
jgi:arylsulfatase A-like enzyme